MIVPQYGSSMRDALSQLPNSTTYGRVQIRDSAGQGLNLLELLRTPRSALGTKIRNGNDRSLANLSKLLSIRIRITWPGYREFTGDVHMGSLGQIAVGIAVVVKEFFDRAPRLERKGEKGDWNIKARNLTISDFVLTALVHYGDDLFHCELERATNTYSRRNF